MEADDRISVDFTEAVILHPDGVETRHMSVLQQPGSISYSFLEPVVCQHGSMIQWSHAVTLCDRCGGVTPAFCICMDPDD